MNSEDISEVPEDPETEAAPVSAPEEVEGAPVTPEGTTIINPAGQ